MKTVEDLQRDIERKDMLIDALERKIEIMREGREGLISSYMEKMQLALVLEEERDEALHICDEALSVALGCFPFVITTSALRRHAESCADCLQGSECPEWNKIEAMVESSFVAAKESMMRLL